MTDYIEKMMKVVKIKPEYLCDYTGNICPIESAGKFNPKCPMPKVVKICNIRCQKKKYPDFTSEKQLEIIKLISRIDEVSYRIDFDGDWYFKIINFHIHNADFSQALAQLTTALMKIGELDKEKVKETLEG